MFHEFEYDEGKNRLNREKHGIDFISCQQLWRSPHVIFPAQHGFENRFAIIGILGTKYYTCIFCYRGNSVRIISCRRSRNKEVSLYVDNKTT